MQHSLRQSLPALLLAGIVLPGPAAAVALGQVDTFENGTTQGWVVNLLGLGFHPAPPVNQASGGPGGADDNFLQLTALGGAGAGSRLSVINPSQWAGDYTGAGVVRIGMDLNNFGSTDLALRLYLANPLGAPPTDYAITDAVLLPGGSGWRHAEFALDPLSLIALAGNVNTLLQNVTELRLFHGPDAAFPGPDIVAQLGVDNIAALPAAVPLPAALPLLGAGLIGLVCAGRTRPGGRVSAV